MAMIVLADDDRDFPESLRNAPRLVKMPSLLISNLVPEQRMGETLMDDICVFFQNPFMPTLRYDIVNAGVTATGN